MRKGSGSKRSCVMRDDEMFYIPILDTLQSLLQCDTIFAEVNIITCKCTCVYNYIGSHLCYVHAYRLKVDIPVVLTLVTSVMEKYFTLTHFFQCIPQHSRSSFTLMILKCAILLAPKPKSIRSVSENLICMHVCQIGA